MIILGVEELKLLMVQLILTQAAISRYETNSSLSKKVLVKYTTSAEDKNDLILVFAVRSKNSKHKQFAWWCVRKIYWA